MRTFFVSLACVVLLACSSSTPTPPPVPTPTPTATPTPTPTPNCPPYYPCDITNYPIPQFADGTDPICYGLLGSGECPVPGGTPLARSLPIEERNALVLATWNGMKEKYDSGEYVDLRTSENVPIRWDNPPTVSACWSQFKVDHPACGPDVPQCTGKATWVTAEPYKPATWRVAIATDVPFDTQRELIVDGTINLVLILTGHRSDLNGPMGLDVRNKVLGR